MSQTTIKKLYFKTVFLSKAFKKEGLRLLKEKQLLRCNEKTPVKWVSKPVVGGFT